MRTENITKTIKKFDEFTEDEQQQIIDNYRDINVDFNDWNDYILYDAIDKIKEQTIFEFEADDFLWSVGSRDSKFGIYSKKVINQLIEKFEDKGVYDIDTPNKIGSFLNHMGGGICKQGTTEQGLATIYFEDDDAEQNKAVSEDINEQIDILIDILKEQHTANEQAYHDAMSDESVRDTLIANEYEFDTETMRIY